MIYPIYVYGSQVLRTEAAEVGPDYPELKQLVADMFESMYAAGGVGLAAPQIGKPIRIFTVDARMYADQEPSLAEMKLVDFKVRVVNSEAATGAAVRVVVESDDGESSWGTIGASENVIEASWIALVDSIEYKLNK